MKWNNRGSSSCHWHGAVQALTMRTRQAFVVGGLKQGMLEDMRYTHHLHCQQAQRDRQALLHYEANAHGQELG